MHTLHRQERSGIGKRSRAADPTAATETAEARSRAAVFGSVGSTSCDVATTTTTTTLRDERRRGRRRRRRRARFRCNTSTQHRKRTEVVAAAERNELLLAAARLVVRALDGARLDEIKVVTGLALAQDVRPVGERRRRVKRSRDALERRLADAGEHGHVLEERRAPVVPAGEAERTVGGGGQLEERSARYMATPPRYHVSWVSLTPTATEAPPPPLAAATGRAVAGLLWREPSRRGGGSDTVARGRSDGRWVGPSLFCWWLVSHVLSCAAWPWIAIRRKVCRPTAHSVQAETALIVAARGAR